MENKIRLLLFALSVFAVQIADAADITAHISIKQPGNPAVTYALTDRDGSLEASAKLPLTITKTVTNDGIDDVVSITFKARERVYFNFGAVAATPFASADCEFYLPGFWYHRNLRSPKEAPSFHTSKAWSVRDDRLSSPLSGVYDMKTGQSMTVLRQVGQGCDALATHTEGEVILSGNTSVGYVGFSAEGPTATLSFGYPYEEAPKRYIRKLTLANPITAFVKLEPGESRTVAWRIHKGKQQSYADFVAKTWELCFDNLNPQPLKPLYSPEEMKATMANYFRESFVDKYDLKFNSGHTIMCHDCKPYPYAQIGFCGRVLLNAFNAIEYGEGHNQPDLVKIGNAILDSYLRNGFTKAGYFYDDVNLRDGKPSDGKVVHSIRQQSEAAYAIMHFLHYEKQHGRQHKDWERKIRTLLDNFTTLQKPDGHFARKFHDNGSDIDASGGSTPSATSTLVMGYKYFGDKKYLKAAERTVEYLERNIISKSDYFSSTLDANCEDKEAAISAVTATYYMAMAAKGKARQHYIALCRQAAYFALSWYYLWDVPFAEGQMLGDLGFKSRGWGNVSVENNHIDVFVFELPHIVRWIGNNLGDKRFLRMYDVIYSSLDQLLPRKGHLCGIAKVGFYPEVVQHTTWDYGRNGKGFYNDLFAPGWTVASLWELYSPYRTENFLKGK